MADCPDCDGPLEPDADPFARAGRDTDDGPEAPELRPKRCPACGWTGAEPAPDTDDPSP